LGVLPANSLNNTYIYHITVSVILPSPFISSETREGGRITHIFQVLMSLSGSLLRCLLKVEGIRTYSPVHPAAYTHMTGTKTHI